MNQTTNTEDTIDLKELFFTNCPMETNCALHYFEPRMRFTVFTRNARYLFGGCFGSG